MSRKKIGLVLTIIGVALVTGVGLFYWWTGQKDVRELNKNLPEGVKVAKTLIGKEYWVKNEIDGYEFKVPGMWGGVKEIEYMPEREVTGYVATSITIERREGGGSIGIDRYSSGGNTKGDLELWAKENFNTFGLVGDFSKDKVEELEIVKTQESVHFGGEYVYFLKKQGAVYSIIGPSEDFIREIITNGKW